MILQSYVLLVVWPYAQSVVARVRLLQHSQKRVRDSLLPIGALETNLPPPASLRVGPDHQVEPFHLHIGSGEFLRTVAALDYTLSERTLSQLGAGEEERPREDGGV